VKPHDCPESGSLDIDLKPEPGTETHALAKGPNVDLDEKGEAVGLDIDFASKRLDLTKLETVALPLGETTAA
jgi:uncharacterized protein YuzE